MTETTEPNTDPNQETVSEPSDDLDALLNEYQEPVKAEPPVKTEQTPSTDEMTEFRMMMEQNRVEKQNEGLNEAAKMVKSSAGDAAGNMPEWMFVGALREEATRNPNLEKVFNERGQNPEAWNKVASALGKKIAHDLNPTDKQATDSWNAVESAVHSSSSSNPVEEAPPNLNKMNDAEFSAYKRGLG